MIHDYWYCYLWFMSSKFLIQNVNLIECLKAQFSRQLSAALSEISRNPICTYKFCKQTLEAQTWAQIWWTINRTTLHLFILALLICIKRQIIHITRIHIFLMRVLENVSRDSSQHPCCHVGIIRYLTLTSNPSSRASRGL